MIWWWKFEWNLNQALDGGMFGWWLTAWNGRQKWDTSGLPVDPPNWRVQNHPTVRRWAQKSHPHKENQVKPWSNCAFQLGEVHHFPKKKREIALGCAMCKYLRQLEQSMRKVWGPKLCCWPMHPKSWGQQHFVDQTMANLACSFFSRFCTGKYIRWVNLGTCITDINLPFNSRKYNHFVFFYHVPRCN